MDEEVVRISPRSQSATYYVNRKEGKYCYITAEKSGRTYKKPLSTKLY